MSYVRLHRGSVTFDRDDADIKNIDSYYIHKPDKRAQFKIVTSGFTAENAVDAARQLETLDGIPTSVINVVNQNTLDTSLPYLLDDDMPIMTVYNGSPATLQTSVSSAVLGNPDIPRPRFVYGHGFIEGTSAGVNELISHFQLDSSGIRQVALSAIAKYGR